MSNLNKNTEELEELLQIANDLPDAGSGDVIPGEDGGYYVPSISQPNADTMQVAFTPSKSDMVDVTPKNITLPKGNAGVSITSVEQIVTSNEDGGTNLIKVTLSDGTFSQFPIRNGSKGSKGNSGVYVGSGTPLDGENVQIDPSAEEELIIPDVLQTTGNSEVDTMSQKAITEALQNIEAMIVNGNEVSY